MRHGYTECVLVLLRVGADADAVNSAGVSALEYARYHLSPLFDLMFEFELTSGASSLLLVGWLVCLAGCV